MNIFSYHGELHKHLLGWCSAIQHLIRSIVVVVGETEGPMIQISRDILHFRRYSREC